MNSEKGNAILLTIIGVATLLVAVAGTTFAYFGVAKNGKESSTVIEVKGERIKASFSDGDTISAQFVNPGEVLVTKTFSVKGKITGSSNSQYEAILNITNNTYPEGSLIYTLTANNDSNNGSTIMAPPQEVAIPTGTNTIELGKGTFAGPISTGAVHTYTLTIKNVNASDPAAVFEAKIDIE